MGACQVEGDDAADDEEDAADFEWGEGFAHEEGADEGDGGGAGSCPDGVGGAHVELEFECLCQEGEGGDVAECGDEGPAGVGEAVAEFECGGGGDLAGDGEGEQEPGHGGSPRCSGTGVPVYSRVTVLAGVGVVMVWLPSQVWRTSRVRVVASKPSGAVGPTGAVTCGGRAGGRGGSAAAS